ncbi:MAG: 30S ribosomal protein S6, partial [Candidatus Diapherotrites archaeon]|nr:30S ribosomal protein S6 [Candidatus Diapherotrites archaeon]
MKIVISDQKAKKAYSKTVEDPSVFFEKKIGEIVNLNRIGLENYEAKITGGSDKDGFPMKKYFA